MKNIFEHGGQEQYDLLVPFLNEIEAYDSRSGIDFPTFYKEVLFRAMHERAEKEEVDDWVFDHKDYQCKSEILFACCLWEKYIRKISELARRPCDFDLEEKILDYLIDLGKTRGWDEDSLKTQFIRSSGDELFNPIEEYVGIINLQGKDYN